MGIKEKIRASVYFVLWLVFVWLIGLIAGGSFMRSYEKNRIKPLEEIVIELRKTAVQEDQREVSLEKDLTLVKERKELITQLFDILAKEQKEKTQSEGR